MNSKIQKLEAEIDSLERQARFAANRTLESYCKSRAGKLRTKLIDLIMSEDRPEMQTEMEFN